VPGSSSPDWLNKSDGCSGSSKCICGYFTQSLIPADESSGTIGGTDLGATTIQLTG
jgi:hypothetical protein